MSKPDGPRIFTVEEANEALPRVRIYFARIFQLQESIRQVGEGLRALGVDILAGHWRAGAGDSPSVLALKADFAAHLDETNALLASIGEAGAVVKDIHRGLVDFHGELDGEVVCLCWQFGEEEVAWWHAADAGFSGRKPIQGSGVAPTLH